MRGRVENCPKYGSWLNRAETESSVLSRQCVARRVTLSCGRNPR
jgi:hypothetical protein